MEVVGWLTAEKVENQPEPEHFDLLKIYARVAAVIFKLVLGQTGNGCCYSNITNLFFLVRQISN